jgi:hypothetical protein
VLVCESSASPVMMAVGCALTLSYQDQSVCIPPSTFISPPTTYPHGVLLFCQLPIYFQCLLAGVRQQNQEQASRPPSCRSATVLPLTSCRPHCPPGPSPAVRPTPHQQSEIKELARPDCERVVHILRYSWWGPWSGKSQLAITLKFVL